LEAFTVNPIMRVADDGKKDGKAETKEIELGVFEFRHRTMRDEFKIGAEYSRLIEGIDHPTKFLAYLSEATSTIKVLLSEGPPGWDIDTLDPLDPETFNKISTIYKALQEKEIFFRKDAKRQSEKERAQ